MMTALPNKHYNGHHRATESPEIQGHQKHPEKRFRKWETAGFKYSWSKMGATELDVDKWSVANVFVSLGAKGIS